MMLSRIADHPVNRIAKLLLGTLKSWCWDLVVAVSGTMIGAASLAINLQSPKLVHAESVTYKEHRIAYLSL
jgi:hypothetical protein